MGMAMFLWPKNKIVVIYIDTMSNPEEIADNVVDSVETQKVVQDNRSNTDDAQDGSNKTSLEDQFKAAEDKTNVKIVDTNVQFANADQVPKEVKEKVIEKLGDQSGKPDWTLEHNVGDAQNQQKLTSNTVPKNVVIL